MVELIFEDVDDFIWTMVMMMLLAMAMVKIIIIPGALGNHSSFLLLFIFHISLSTSLLLSLTSFSLRCHPEFFLDDIVIRFRG